MRYARAAWRLFARSTLAAVASTLASAMQAWMAVESVISQRGAWQIGLLLFGAVVYLILPMLPEDEPDPATMDEVRF